MSRGWKQRQQIKLDHLQGQDHKTKNQAHQRTLENKQTRHMGPVSTSGRKKNKIKRNRDNYQIQSHWANED